MRHAGDRVSRGSVPEVMSDGVTGFVVDTSTRRSRRPRASSSCRARACANTSRSASWRAAWRRLRGGLRGAGGRRAPPQRAGGRRSGWRRSTKRHDGDVAERRGATPARRHWDGQRHGRSARMTTRSSASRISSTSWRRRRAPTTARACSSRARRFAVFDRYGDIAPVGRASRASTTTARASCRGWSCASAAAAAAAVVDGQGGQRRCSPST